MLASRSFRPRPTCWRVRLTRRAHCGRERPARQCSHCASQLGRLVVAAGDQPLPVQRHRHHQLRLGDQLVSRPHHPACHPAGEVGTVAIFEPSHHLAGNAPIGHCRARPAEGRRLGDRLERDQPLAHIVVERRPHDRTPGPLEEAKRRPAAAAQRARRGHLPRAARAERRQQPPARPAQRQRGTPPRPCDRGRPPLAVPGLARAFPAALSHMRLAEPVLGKRNCNRR